MSTRSQFIQPVRVPLRRTQPRPRVDWKDLWRRFAPELSTAFAARLIHPRIRRAQSLPRIGRPRA